MKSLRSLVDRWIEQPGWDYLVTALAVAAVLAVKPHDPVSAGQQGAWIQTLAAVDGVMLGVSGIALTLVFTVTPNDRLISVYAAAGPKLSRLMLSSLGGLAVTTVGFAALFLLEGQPEHRRVAAVVGLVTFAGLRLARLWWLMRRIALALSAPGVSATGSTAEWVRPEVGPRHYELGRRPASPLERVQDPASSTGEGRKRQ
jgi:hypothetical protein